jgi:hypothetical protein
MWQVEGYNVTSIQDPLFFFSGGKYVPLTKVRLFTNIRLLERFDEYRTMPAAAGRCRNVYTLPRQSTDVGGKDQIGG